MKINLTCEDGIAANAVLTLEDGTPVHGVERIKLDVKGHEPVRAELTFWLPKLAFKSLPVGVSEEHLRELADAYGFDLVKRNG